MQGPLALPGHICEHKFLVRSVKPIGAALNATRRYFSLRTKLTAHTFENSPSQLIRLSGNTQYISLNNISNFKLILSPDLSDRHYSLAPNDLCDE